MGFFVCLGGGGGLQTIFLCSLLLIPVLKRWLGKRSGSIVIAVFYSFLIDFWLILMHVVSTVLHAQGTIGDAINFKNNTVL